MTKCQNTCQFMLDNNVVSVCSDDCYTTSVVIFL